MTRKKNYRLEWTRSAEVDLETVIDFIARSNPQNALQILQKIRVKATTLKQGAMRGRKLPELSYIGGLPYRELIITPWRLIYQIDNNSVQILGFFDGRRDLEDILYERLTRFSDNPI